MAQSVSSKWIALAVLSALLMAISATPRGRIDDVSADGRSFTVGAGDVSFRVEPGFGTRFPTLRSGDRVLVVGTLRSQTRLTASEVRVLPGSGPRTLTGALRDLDPRRNRL